MNGIIPYAKLRKQGPLGDEDWETLQGIVEDEVGDVAEASIADVYSSSSTYAVGDYCIYNGALYRCNTAISTAEVWTAAHWTATNFGDEIANVKADLLVNQNGYCRFNVSDFVIGTYGSSGVVTDPRRMTTPICISFDHDTTIKCETGYRFSVMIYDNTGTEPYISASGWCSDPYFVPANTKVKITLANSPDRTTALYSGDEREYLTHFSIVDSVGSQALKGQTAFNMWTAYDNNLYSHEFVLVPNSYVATNGTIYASNSDARTDYIPIKGGEVLHYSATAASVYNVFFNASKQFISSFSVSISSDKTVDVPTTARYVMFSGTKASMQDLKVWSFMNALDPLYAEFVDPYYFNRYTGDIVNGDAQADNGAFVKFSNLNLKLVCGRTFSLTWANAKSDLTGVANVAFTESYDYTTDCLRLLKNFVLLYDLTSMKFDVQYYTAILPTKCIVLFGTDSNSNPYGTLYEQTKDNEKIGINNYLSDVKGKEEDLLGFGDDFTFTFATDVHYFFNKTTGYYNSTNEVLAELDNDICVDAHINGGDSVLYGSKDRTYAIGALNQVFNEIDKNKIVYCIGNHDFNGVGSVGVDNNEDWMLDNKGVETLLLRHNQNIVRPAGKRYFYRDFDAKKVRIISLDTSDIDVTFDANGDVEIDPLTTYGVRQAQLEWLCNTALSVPTDDWKILIVMHVGLYTSEDGFTGNNTLINRDAIRNILNKYVAKDAYSYADTDTTYNGYFTISGSGSFASYHGTLIAVLSGHAHYDGYTSKNGFNAIQTICSYPDVAQHSDRVVRTIDEVAVECGCIDTTNQKIILKRFGYGSDREYSY